MYCLDLEPTGNAELNLSPGIVVVETGLLRRRESEQNWHMANVYE